MVCGMIRVADWIQLCLFACLTGVVIWPECSTALDPITRICFSDETLSTYVAGYWPCSSSGPSHIYCQWRPRQVCEWIHSVAM